MKVNEIATRYAKAIFQLAWEDKAHDKVFSELRQLNELFKGNKEFDEFMHSPLISAQQKEKAITEAVKDRKLSLSVQNLLKLLARKNRLAFFSDVVASYQDECDEAHGVSRGAVRSAIVLESDERSRIEKIVQEKTGKNVILSYSVDPELIGGLVAQVGSYMFDDSIDSHLRRLNEDLNRSNH